ncbi:hypothetical protein DFA_00323 [Cavenderia fasciculata]|uniref:Uncharacterized protein n=1 Tax=Cavenderia fasciculata TaxID=261658 RepID=F4PY85_CACFS|nr:uncharacterized protein DFA_00323 [Cavenderia fasciculata]EGG19745.1 hypothetical protein DFA_00323 [Cavenderia fasciculata]|eukprot:XP_004358039.1 hypothetical protein DFA_00323 [Cavenderia fasciculata]
MTSISIPLIIQSEIIEYILSQDVTIAFKKRYYKYTRTVTYQLAMVSKHWFNAVSSMISAIWTHDIFSNDVSILVRMMLSQSNQYSIIKQLRSLSLGVNAGYIQNAFFDLVDGILKQRINENQPSMPLEHILVVPSFMTRHDLIVAFAKALDTTQRSLFPSLNITFHLPPYDQELDDEDEDEDEEEEYSPEEAMEVAEKILDTCRGVKNIKKIRIYQPPSDKRPDEYSTFGTQDLWDTAIRLPHKTHLQGDLSYGLAPGMLFEVFSKEHDEDSNEIEYFWASDKEPPGNVYAHEDRIGMAEKYAGYPTFVEELFTLIRECKKVKYFNIYRVTPNNTEIDIKQGYMEAFRDNTVMTTLKLNYEFFFTSIISTNILSQSLERFKIILYHHNIKFILLSSSSSRSSSLVVSGQSINNNSNCTIGGWTADSCFDYKYIYNNQNYTVTFNNTVLDIPVGTSLYFVGDVVIDSTVDLRFNCKAESKDGKPSSKTYCNQIETKGTFYYGVIDVTATIDMMDNLYPEWLTSLNLTYTFHTLNLVEGKVKALNLSEYSSVFIHTNQILPSIMDDFNCEYISPDAFSSKIYCVKNGKLSPGMMVNVSATCPDTVCFSLPIAYFKTDLMTLCEVDSVLTRGIKNAGGSYEYRIKVNPASRIVDPYPLIPEFIQNLLNVTITGTANNTENQIIYNQTLLIYVNNQLVHANGTTYEIPADSSTDPNPEPSSASYLNQSKMMMMMIIIIIVLIAILTFFERIILGFLYATKNQICVYMLCKQPSSKFIDVIEKLAIEREKKKTNNKKDDNNRYTSNNNYKQLYNDMITTIEKGQEETVISWLLHYCCRTEKYSSLKKLISIAKTTTTTTTTTTTDCYWNYNRDIVQPTFNVLISNNNNNNDVDYDEESKTLLISILTILNVSATDDEYLEYLKLLENTIRNRRDKEEHRNLKKQSDDIRACNKLSPFNLHNSS